MSTGNSGPGLSVHTAVLGMAEDNSPYQGPLHCLGGKRLAMTPTAAQAVEVDRALDHHMLKNDAKPAGCKSWLLLHH